MQMTGRFRRPEYFWSHLHDKMVMPSIYKKEKAWEKPRSTRFQRTQTDHSSRLIGRKLADAKKLKSWVNAKKRVRDFLYLKQVIVFSQCGGFLR